MFPSGQSPSLSPFGRGFPPGREGRVDVRPREPAYGLLFDGVNDRAERTGLGFGAPLAFTALGRVVFPTVAGTDAHILDTRATAALNGFGLQRSGTQLVAFSVGPSGTIVSTSAAVGLLAGQRYHLALRVSNGGADLHLFCNGAVVATLTGIPAAARPDAFVRMQFGARADSTFPCHLIASHWSVFRRALTADEILQAALGTHPLDATDRIAFYPFESVESGPTTADASGNGRPLTLVNMPANPISVF